MCVCVCVRVQNSSLRGVEAMDLWDSLCSILGAQEISVKDVSRKHFLELRLIHSIAYGTPWYGRWGYEFGRGCYGITAKMYQEAKTNLQSLSLQSLLGKNHRVYPCLFLPGSLFLWRGGVWAINQGNRAYGCAFFLKTEEQVKASSRVGRIIDHYVRLAASLKEPYHLKTLGDLIRFLMDYKRISTSASTNTISDSQKRKRMPRGKPGNGKMGSRKSASKTSSSSISNVHSAATIRWSDERLKYAFKV